MNPYYGITMLHVHQFLFTGIFFQLEIESRSTWRFSCTVQEFVFFKLENHEKIVAVVQKISMENYQIRIKFEKKKLPAHLYVWPDEFWVDSRI